MNLTLFRIDKNLAPLSESEANVARQIAMGKTVKEIAANNHKSEHTINQQRRMGMFKTGAKNAADLVRWTISRYSGKSEDSICNAIKDSMVIAFVVVNAYIFIALA